MIYDYYANTVTIQYPTSKSPKKLYICTKIIFHSNHRSVQDERKSYSYTVLRCKGLKMQFGKSIIPVFRQNDGTD